MANWGRDTVGGSGVIRWGVVQSGAFPGGTLNSVAVHLSSASGSSSSRSLAVYAGGAADDDPTGATLVESLGAPAGSAPGWYEAVSASNPTIPAGRVWIAYSSTSGSNQVSHDDADAGDFSASTVVTTGGSEPLTDHAEPWPSTFPQAYTDRLSEQTTTASAYLDYTPGGPAPTTITIDQSDPQQVEVGSTIQLSATVTNGDGATTWASDDEAVATVDASGLVSGVAIGSAEITATNNGVSDSITVNVEAAPAQAPTVTITSPAGNIAVTEGTTIVATATATDPVDGDLSASVEWTSSVDGALGTGASIQIDTDGWTEGNRTITATATNAAELEGSDDFTLTIGEAPEPPEPEARFDAARFAINAAGGIA